MGAQPRPRTRRLTHLTRSLIVLAVVLASGFASAQGVAPGTTRSNASTTTSGVGSRFVSEASLVRAAAERVIEAVRTHDVEGLVALTSAHGLTCGDDVISRGQLRNLSRAGCAFHARLFSAQE